MRGRLVKLLTISRWWQHVREDACRFVDLRTQHMFNAWAEKQVVERDDTTAAATPNSGSGVSSSTAPSVQVDTVCSAVVDGAETTTTALASTTMDAPLTRQQAKKQRKKQRKVLVAAHEVRTSDAAVAFDAPLRALPRQWPANGPWWIWLQSRRPRRNSTLLLFFFRKHLATVRIHKLIRTSLRAVVVCVLHPWLRRRTSVHQMKCILVLHR